MIDLNEPIFVCTTYVDMRKSIDGLAMLVSVFAATHACQSPKCDLLATSTFVFTNRGRDKIKILVKENNGFCLFYKRLDRGSFKLNLTSNEPLLLTKQQLRWLLDGLDYTSIKSIKTRTYSLTY